MVPRQTPAGLVICSARTYTRDYQDAVAAWARGRSCRCGAPSPSGSPSRPGPDGWLAPDGLDAYRTVWRRAQRSPRG